MGLFIQKLRHILAIWKGFALGEHPLTDREGEFYFFWLFSEFWLARVIKFIV